MQAATCRCHGTRLLCLSPSRVVPGPIPGTARPCLHTPALPTWSFPCTPTFRPMHCPEAWAGFLFGSYSNPMAFEHNPATRKPHGCRAGPSLSSQKPLPITFEGRFCQGGLWSSPCQVPLMTLPSCPDHLSSNPWGLCGTPLPVQCCGSWD